MANEIVPSTSEFKSPDAIPFIYFDHVPSFGVANGSIQLELAARALNATGDGKTRSDLIGTARLRCTPMAARILRDAIDKLLMTLSQPTQIQVPTPREPDLPKGSKRQRHD